MLLETLDIKEEDIVIYSLNIYDLANNFKIIFKDDPSKEIRKIVFDDEWRKVNEFTPKNLIVYRLLTNVDNFTISNSEFGYSLFINFEPEVIYLIRFLP